MERADAIYILADREDPVCIMDADYLAGYLENGFASYLTAEEAEEGRKRGDAYDSPGLTRVVGFRVTPFLPKKERRKPK